MKKSRKRSRPEAVCPNQKSANFSHHPYSPTLRNIHQPAEDPSLSELLLSQLQAMCVSEARHIKHLTSLLEHLDPGPTRNMVCHLYEASMAFLEHVTAACGQLDTKELTGDAVSVDFRGPPSLPESNEIHESDKTGIANLGAILQIYRTQFIECRSAQSAAKILELNELERALQLMVSRAKAICCILEVGSVRSPTHPYK